MTLKHPADSRPLPRARAVFAVLGATTVAATSVLVLASAPASADTTTAVVRSAHFSPDTPGVDVYLSPFSGGAGTTLWVADEKYGTLSQYEHIAPGAYVVSMRLHDAPASSKPVLSWTLNATAGSAYTAAAIGRNADLQAVVLTDTLTPPAAGTGRVRVVQAAGTAASVSVEANGGVVLASKLAFGSTSGYKTVPTGRWDVRATSDSGSATAVTSSVPIPAGSSSTLVVTDGSNGALRLTSVQDSASAGTMPVGSVDAGGGGTATTFADPSTSFAAVWVVAGSFAVVGSLTVVSWSRRRRARV